ncbi:DUF2867 domain-containing protein [Variovorax paradoxus]|jgi:hypothetical protein|uniref:DUF2867 domain-containing protein n=1 Tax=Variovorax paradoxus TaxID=34073 RepID=UPI003AAB4BF4
MTNNHRLHKSRREALPPGACVAGLYRGAFLADAFAIDLPPGATRDVMALARFAFERPAPWVDRLMALRDRLVSGFGIKTASALRADRPGGAPRVGIFRIYETHANEVVLGEDDRHLDFRVSVMRSVAGDSLTAVTVVHCHNLFGRNYIRLIAPFHRLVVRSALERAARSGWPAEAAG